MARGARWPGAPAPRVAASVARGAGGRAYGRPRPPHTTAPLTSDVTVSSSSAGAAGSDRPDRLDWAAESGFAAGVDEASDCASG